LSSRVHRNSNYRLVCYDNRCIDSNPDEYCRFILRHYRRQHRLQYRDIHHRFQLPGDDDSGDDGSIYPADHGGFHATDYRLWPNSNTNAARAHSNSDPDGNDGVGCKHLLRREWLDFMPGLNSKFLSKLVTLQQPERILILEQQSQ